MSERLFRRPGALTWYCWFYDRHGSRKKRSTGCTDQRAARAVLRRLEQGAQGAAPGLSAAEEAYSVEEALFDMREVGLGDLATATQKFYEQKGGHLTRLLGKLPAGELTYSVLLDYANQRQKAEGAHPGTVKKEFVTLRKALLLAMRREKIANFNPLIIPPIRGAYTPRERWLTPDEYRRLLLALGAAHRDYLRVAVYTGARKSELERLEVLDVDLAAGRILLAGRKTVRAHRRIPIEEPLRRTLEALKKTPPKARKGTITAPGRLLVRWPNVDRDLRRACVRIGIPHVSCNDLRRTFASWMLQRGVPTLDVARLLGHGSSSMVERVYGQLVAENLFAAVRALPDPEGLGGVGA